MEVLRSQSLTPRIATKRIYEPADPADGTRVLIMRLWPRGIRKDRVTMWRKELGPIKELLRDFLDKKVDWPTYTRRYLAGLERPEAREAIAEVLALAEQGPVTLLCGCADESHCHRSLLAAHLRAAPAAHLRAAPAAHLRAALAAHLRATSAPGHGS